MNDELASLRRIPYEVLDDGRTIMSSLSEQLVDLLYACPGTPRVRKWLYDLLNDTRTSSSIAGILEENPCGLLYDMDDLESPLEVAAACWLYNELYYYRWKFEPMGLDISVKPQQKLTVDGEAYRVDFLVRVKVKSDNVQPESLRGAETLVAVECDGHEYHEKTKQQAVRDKKRDRTLQAAGIPILRYTGSEIYKGRTATMAQALFMCVNIFARAHGIKTSSYKLIIGE